MSVTARRTVSGELAARWAAGVSSSRERELIDLLPLVAFAVHVQQPRAALYVSGGIESLLGYRAEELFDDADFLGRLLHAEDRADVLASLDRQLSQGYGYSAELRLVARDGTVVWAQAAIAASTAGAYAIGYLIERTDDRLGREALEGSASRLRLLADELPVVIWTTDGALRLTSLMGEALGVEDGAPDFPATPELADVFEPAGERVDLADLQHRALDGRSEACTLARGRRVFEARIAPLAGPGGDLVGTLGIALDVTARRNAEDELRRNEAYFRSLIENASEIIAVLDADGRIRYVSASVERVLAYEPAELLGRKVFELLDEDSVALVKDAFARADGVPLFTESIELRARRRDGEWRILDATGKNVLQDPAVAGIVVNARDVTARRTAEIALQEHQERLRQGQKLEAIGRLAGGVAHDFNNVVTTVIGNAGLLLSECQEDDEARRRLETIERAGQRAAALTNQLLTFSRRRVLTTEVLDANEILREAGPLLERLVPAHIQLRTALQPNMPCVEVDLDQLVQVVINLVCNARDAMPTGGVVDVSTSVAELDPRAARALALEPGRYVRISVSDTGTGMDEETSLRIFEPFFTTKDVGRGTGLGLANVRGIVEQSAGAIAVETELGRGTALHVYLPPSRRPRERKDVSPTIAAPSATGGETILVVEDDEGVRPLLEEALEIQGYRVLTAVDGGEALEVAERFDGPIHLLVTDVVLPGRPGPELALRLNERRPGLDVLFISGYGDPGGPGDPTSYAAPLVTSAPLLQKPFTLREFVEQVRLLLGPVRKPA